MIFGCSSNNSRDGRIAREIIAYFHMLSDVIFSSCKFSEIGRFLKVYIVKTISMIMDHLRIQVDWEREDVDIV